MSRELHSTLKGRVSSIVNLFGTTNFTTKYFTSTKIKPKTYRKKILIIVTMKIGNYQERQQAPPVCIDTSYMILYSHIFTDTELVQKCPL